VEDCAYERWVRLLHELDRRVRLERKGRRYVEGRSASLCWCGFSLVGGPETK